MGHVQLQREWSFPSAHLQFLGPLVAQRLEGEAQVVVVGQRAQVKVVLGIDAGRDVDVELEQLQEVTLHLIPVQVLIIGLNSV